METQGYTRTLEAKESARRFFATLLMTLAFAIYYLPAGYAVSATVYNAWRTTIIAVSAIVLIVYLEKCKISLRWALLVLFLLAYYLLSTVFAHSDGSSFQVFFNIVRVGGFATLLEYGLSNNKDQCLRAFLIAGVIMCAVHYGTYLRYHDFPHGMREATYATIGEVSRQHWFFLTHDNGSVFYFLPLLTCAWYYAINKADAYWLPILLSIFTLLMYWTLWTVSAMVATTIAVALFVVIWKTDCISLRSFMTYRRAIAIGIGFCLIVLVFYSSDLISYVANFFGKANDLGRGRIWTRAIPLFAESPIFGVGFESDATTTLRLGINHCHNVLVQVLYTGGVTAIALGALWISLCQPERSYADSMISKTQCILCVSIIAFFVVATFDWYLYMPIQFFPFVLYAYTTNDDIGDDASANNGANIPNSATTMSWSRISGRRASARKFR